MPDLIIADAVIVQDVTGRYRLNDLHRISGAKVNKNPGEWLKNKTTQALISEVYTHKGNSPCDVVTGGSHAGVYAHELLAVSYAGWLSPTFQLKVNQAFLDSKQQVAVMPTTRGDLLVEMAEAYRQQERRILELENARVDQQQQLIDQQAALIAHLQLAQSAETKASMALANQQWLTIRQYRYLNQLERQMPDSLCKSYGTFLTSYCLEHGIPVEERGVADRFWGKEHAYHAQAILDTLSGWLAREHAQGALIPIARGRRG